MSIFGGMSVTLRAALVALSFVVGAVGCGSADEGGATAEGKAGKSQSRKGQAVDASKVRPDMVAAVSASTAGPPVALKFALNQRPMVGEPIDIDVALIPISDLTRLFVKFQPSTGLTLVKGAESPQFDSPRTGEPIHHTVTVMASVDGIYYITAAVVADAAESSLTRTFSIPVIAGNGVAAPAKPTARVGAAPADKSP
jgi:hypothetical protein